LRIGFITCVRLGESCLRELSELGADLVYLGTLHDDLGVNKSGRVYLDEFASEHDIHLHKFKNMNDAAAVKVIRAADLDWLYVIGWSQMAGAEVLSLPRRGVVGIHPTLLPQGRGRASIPWAIIKGLDTTGVTMFKLDEGMDTGPILGQVAVPIAADETSTTLYDKVVDAHRVLIRRTYPAMAAGSIEPRPQDESVASVWPGRKPGDGRLSPASMMSAEVDRHVRALTHPYPGASIDLGGGTSMRIWAGRVGSHSQGHVIATSDGFYTALDFSVESAESIEC
jgi:methionyl-tRNA formyltransferase